MKRGDASRYLKLLPYPTVSKEIVRALSVVVPRKEEVQIDSALGRVCAESVISPVDVPAISTSAMDGYAIRSVESERASGTRPALFRVRGSLQPGSERPRNRVKGMDACYVGTGTPVPEGADAVVKIEEVRAEGNSISISRAVPKWKNVVPRGDDFRRGAVAIRRGHMVNAADIALLIAVGKSSLSVFRAPRIGILSTGDELTTLDRAERGKKVNNYANLLAGYLTDVGSVPVPLGVAGDGGDAILDTIQQNVASLDGIVTLGGSSVGERDSTAAALKRVSGSVEVFHGIKLVPIRPTGLYMLDGKPVVLLPGHCVAAALSFFLVARPVLNLLSGLSFQSRTATVKASLSDSVSNPRSISALFLARLAETDGRFVAKPLLWGSDRISSLVQANGYLTLGAWQSLKPGSEVTVELLGTREFSRIPGGNTR